MYCICAQQVCTFMHHMQYMMCMYMYCIYSLHMYVCMCVPIYVMYCIAYSYSIGTGDIDGNQQVDAHTADGSCHFGPFPRDVKRGQPSHQFPSRENHAAHLLGAPLRLPTKLLLQLHYRQVGPCTHMLDNT